MKRITRTAEQRKNLMATEPLPKLILQMAFPTIVAFLINTVYSLADTFFVSSLGTNATAAVSVNASLDQIIMMAGSLLAVGSNSYISRLLGAKKDEEANRVLSTAFFLAILFGVVVLLVGLSFIYPMVRLLGATDNCEQYAVDYATYVLLVAPIMSASFVMNQCLRSEGSAVLSMIGMGFGGILNCILDPIFIFALDLGVAGASIATAISKFVSFLILLFPYATRKSLVRLSIRYFRLAGSMLKEIFSVGVASFLRSAFAVVSAIVLNHIAGSISDSVLAGIGVSTKVMMFPFSILLGFGTGFQPVVGYNWGAKLYQRVKEGFKFASIASAVTGVLLCVIFGAFAPQLVGLFAESDPAMQQIGVLCIRLQCLALPIHAWVAVVNMLCAGLGDGRNALLLSTSRQGTCFIPIAHLLAYLFGANGVAAVQAVADVLSLILAIPILRTVMRRMNEAQNVKNEVL